MTDETPLNIQLGLMMNKAERAIEAAKRQCQDGDYDFASSRAYYSVFYMLEAVLLTKELSFSRHAGVISGFNREFVKTGLFPKDFSRLVSRLSRERQTADYDFDLSIDKRAALQDIAAAETIISAIAIYLQNQGYLSE